MKTSRFSVSLCFFAFCLFIASSQTQNLLYCADTNPDRTQACALIFDPVCANYPTQCSVSPCSQVKDFPNSCVACADSNVQSYISGPCPIEDVTSGEQILGAENAENGEGEGEGEAGENGVSMTEEILDEGGVYCNVTAGATVSCAADLDPVCGFFNGQDFGTTSTNACVACYEDGVDYYLPGNCPEDDILNTLL